MFFTFEIHLVLSFSVCIFSRVTPMPFNFAMGGGGFSLPKISSKIFSLLSFGRENSPPPPLAKLNDIGVTRKKKMITDLQKNEKKLNNCCKNSLNLLSSQACFPGLFTHICSLFKMPQFLFYLHVMSIFLKTHINSLGGRLHIPTKIVLSVFEQICSSENILGVFNINFVVFEKFWVKNWKIPKSGLIAVNFTTQILNWFLPLFTPFAWVNRQNMPQKQCKIKNY